MLGCDDEVGGDARIALAFDADVAGEGELDGLGDGGGVDGIFAERMEAVVEQVLVPGSP